MKKIDVYRDLGSWYGFYFYLKIQLLKLDQYDEYLPETGTIVDMGCGYGLVANYLALCLPNSKVTGVDLDAKRIQIASATVGSRKNIQFVNADAISWSMQDECSMIIMTDFLHHVSFENQKIMLQYAYDNLQDNGALIISEVDASIRPIYKYWNSCLFDIIFYPLSISYFSKSSILLSILRDLGFEITLYFPKSYIFAEIVYVCRRK